MNKIWGLVFVWLVGLLGVLWMPSGSRASKSDSPKSAVVRHNAIRRVGSVRHSEAGLKGKLLAKGSRTLRKIENRPGS